MEKRYETVLVFKQNMSQEDINKAIDEIVKFLEERGAYDIEVDSWGQRKLAYLMKKNTYGHYFCIYYGVEDTSVPNQLTAFCRLNEDLLRYQTHSIVINKKTKQTKRHPEEQSVAS